MVVDVPPRAAGSRSAGRGAGRASSRRRQPACRSAAALGVPEQQLEQRDQVVGCPTRRPCSLAEPELAARREPAEEARRRGSAASTAGARCRSDASAVGQPHLERAALELRRAPARGSTTATRSSSGEPRAPAARRAGSVSAVLTARTEPLPGHEGRLVVERHALQPEPSACQWISAVTCAGMQRVADERRGERTRSSAPGAGRAGRRGAAVRPPGARRCAPHTLLARLREDVPVAPSRPKNGETCRRFSCS